MIRHPSDLCRRRRAAALLACLVLLPSFLPAQMPPHPTLLREIAAGRRPAPYVLDHLSDLRARGVDAPWHDHSLDAVQQTGTHPGPFTRTLGLASPPTGTWRALVILIDFSDNVSQVTASSYDGILFSTDTGSLRDYYRKVSYNALDIVTVHFPGTIGWLRAPNTYAYYVNANNGFGTYPRNAQKLTEDAVSAANAVVDFSRYDNDGDGYVDALFIVHAGSGGEYTGSVNDIWSHAWTTSSPILVDGVHVYHYSMEPEFWVTPGDMTMGVYAHELGHAAFGLPDLYDRDYTSEGLGDWSLMAGGSWNGPGVGGASPSWPDAYCHAQMGYLSVTNIPANTAGVQIHAVENTSEAYRLWTDGAAGNQYFLVENRQQTGSDAYLPGSGLLVYHVDESVTSQNDNEWYPGHTGSGHYFVALAQADGNFELDRGFNRGDAGDPFPGSANAVNYTFGTTPDTRDYSGGNTNIRVRNISSSAAVMTADMEVSFSGTALTLLSPNGGEQLQAGATQLISWEFLGTSGGVNLEYTVNSGTTWMPIATAGPPGAGGNVARSDAAVPAVPANENALASTPGTTASYTWLVPMASSGSCKVRVTSVVQPLLTDESNRTFTMTFPGGDPWSIQFNVDATTITGAGGNAAAVFIPTVNEIWTSRWASSVLHRWTPSGALIGAFTVSGLIGVRGMTFDGTNVIAANTTSTLYAVNPSTRSVALTIATPTVARYVAFDPTADGGSGGYWIGNFASDPMLVKKNGTSLRSIPYGTLGSVSNYGAAFDTYSDGGPFLWLWGQGSGSGTPQWMVQVNPATGLPTGVKHNVNTDVGAGMNDGLAGGMFLSPGVVPNTVTIGGLLQGTNNRLFGYLLKTLVPSFAVRVILEGPYDASTHLMKNSLRSAGRLAAHFGSMPIPGAAIDSIAIELRNSATAGGSTVRRFLPAWLLADGSIRSFSDTAKPFLSLTITSGDYYIVVTHRNHIAAMSASPVHVGSSSFLYDFTTGAGQYYGGQAKGLAGGVFGMFAGDADGNGSVDTADRAAAWSARNTSGYLPADVDLSGDVNATDRVLTWNNRRIGTHVP